MQILSDNTGTCHCLNEDIHALDGAHVLVPIVLVVIVVIVVVVVIIVVVVHVADDVDHGRKERHHEREKRQLRVGVPPRQFSVIVRPGCRQILCH